MAETPTGFHIIKSHLATMPTAPGVYQMLDATGTALYVGKAKNLKNRVTSYTTPAGLSQRIMNMVNKVARLEITTTGSEAEALLLEANLVKRLQPRYNILLRDDKSFPFIMLTGDHDFPQIRKHRGGPTQKGNYYGPFASVHAVNQTITILQRAFLLRVCSDSVFKNRHRPCLQYQIKRCSAPCVNFIAKEDYAKLVGQTKDFLSGKSREIQEQLAEQMQRLSTEEQYEAAAELRDRIKALTQVQREHGIHAPTLAYADVIVMHRAGGVACVQVYFFRSGQNFGNKSYFPSHAAESTDEDVIIAFLGQFYQTHMPPKQIVLSHPISNADILQQALEIRAEQKYKIEILHPQKGEKREVVQQALNNAKATLTRHLLEHASQRQLLEGVAELFKLEAVPDRIEVYDNSHISGTNAVGAMIVAGPMGFEKKSYRQFNIKNLATTPGDDYAMLREVLTRRLVRLEKEDGEMNSASWPNLLLIDGGQGHLGVATEVMNELGITTIPYVCIAKGVDRNAGREWFFMPGREPFQLPAEHPVLHYLQRLRDEAHRFAIGTHRNKRSKNAFTSPLDAITGIGPTRKKALLHHFGSARDVSTASLADLEKVPGIDRKVARLIYDHFHG